MTSAILDPVLVIAAAKLAVEDRERRRSNDASISIEKTRRVDVLRKLAEAALCNPQGSRVITVSLEDFTLIADYYATPQPIGARSGPSFPNRVQD